MIDLEHLAEMITQARALYDVLSEANQAAQAALEGNTDEVTSKTAQSLEWALDGAQTAANILTLLRIFIETGVDEWTEQNQKHAIRRWRTCVSLKNA